MIIKINYIICRCASVCLFLLVFYGTGEAQIETKILSPKKMKKDLKALLETLEAHPDPFTKISEEDFLDIVHKVEENIKVQMDEIDFYKNIS